MNVTYMKIRMWTEVAQDMDDKLRPSGSFGRITHAICHEGMLEGVNEARQSDQQVCQTQIKPENCEHYKVITASIYTQLVQTVEMASSIKNLNFETAGRETGDKHLVTYN